MLPDRVSNPGPLTYESGALPIALRGPAVSLDSVTNVTKFSDQPLMLEKYSLHISYYGDYIGCD